VRSAVLDGEGVICGADGRSEFDRMRACFSREGAPEAFLYAFDLLELDSRDLRNEPWVRRRGLLVQLLADAEAGVRLNDHIEDVDGAVVFRQACVMGLEGIVAKHRDSRYRSGRCRAWAGQVRSSSSQRRCCLLKAISIAARSPGAPGS
jgi:bifunctional non-homologous end joining protein LigD